MTASRQLASTLHAARRVSPELSRVCACCGADQLKYELLPLVSDVTISALTLLVWGQKGHPACKNRVVGCRCGYLSGARCRLAYGPAFATATRCLLLH